MKTKVKYLSVIGSLLVIISMASQVSTTTALAEEVYYHNDFEDADDVKFWCGGEYTLNSKGIVSTQEGEKAYSGARSLKLDITLKKGKFNFLKGPTMKIPVNKNKPVYFSGYIYPSEIPPDIEVKFGLSYRHKKGEKYLQGNYRIVPVSKADRGWVFQQQDVYKHAKRKGIEEYGWSEEDLYLEHWYISIGSRSSEGFHNQRVVIYIDEVRVSSEKEKMVGATLAKMEAEKSEILTGGPYIVKCKSFFKDRPENPHNLVDNSSFELGMKNWEIVDHRYGTNTNWEIDEREAFHGKRSLKILRSEFVPLCNQLIRSQLIPKITEGERYTLSAYMKSDKPGVKVKIDKKSFSLTDTWKRYVVPIESIKSSNIHTTSGKYYAAINLKPEANIWIDAVQLENGELSSYKLPSSVEMALSTTKRNNVYYTGETPILLVDLFNATGETVSPVVTYKITDFREETIKEGKLNFLLNKGEGKTKKIELASQKGYFKIFASLEGKGLKRKEWETSFGIISPLSNKDASKDSFFGHCAFTLRSPLLHMSMCEDIGMKWAVIYSVLAWSCANENWKESYGRWEATDILLSMLEKHSITPVMYIGWVPKWALKGRQRKTAYPDIIQGWYEYNYEVVRRYKDRIKHWVIWSEFCGGMTPETITGADSYFKFIKSAYQAIKEADPDAVVIGCGEDTVSQWCLIPQVEAHFKMGSLDYMDVVGLDAYCRPYSPEDLNYSGMIDKLNEVIKKHNNGKGKDIRVTEAGWNSLDTFYYDLDYARGKRYSGFITELAQADYIIRHNIISLAKGVKQYDTFIFLPTHPDRPSIWSLSMVNPGCLSPKCSYVAYGAMVNQLRGAKFIEEIKIGKNIRCYHFNNKENKPVIVIWNYDKAHKPISLRVNLNPENVKITNMVGNPVSFGKGEKELPLTLTGSPLYIEASGIKDSSFIKAFKEAEIKTAKIDIHWGKRPSTILVTLKNDSNERLKGKVSLEVPVKWTLQKSAFPYELRPGQEEEMKFAFGKITFNPLKDSLTVKAASQKAEATAEFNPIPCFYTEKPLFIDGDLNKKEWEKAIPIELGKNAIRSCGEAPLSEWQGKDDLTAAVYTLWDKDYFYLGVKVTDSIFSNPHIGEMIWANDALQVAFDTLNDAHKQKAKDCYNSDDYEYNLSLTKDGPKVFGGQGGGNTGEAKKVKLVVKRREGKLYYEAAFPWSTLAPFNPDLCRDMGFNLTVMDNDGDMVEYKTWKGFKQWLQISDGIAGGKRPSAFRDLILIK